MGMILGQPKNNDDNITKKNKKFKSNIEETVGIKSDV